MLPNLVPLRFLDPEPHEFSLLITDVLQEPGDGPSKNMGPGPWLPMATRGQHLSSMQTQSRVGFSLPSARLRPEQLPGGPSKAPASLV